jgi:hypothetical protein
VYSSTPVRHFNARRLRTHRTRTRTHSSFARLGVSGRRRPVAMLRRGLLRGTWSPALSSSVRSTESRAGIIATRGADRRATRSALCDPRRRSRHRNRPIPRGHDRCLRAAKHSLQSSLLRIGSTRRSTADLPIGSPHVRTAVESEPPELPTETIAASGQTPAPWCRSLVRTGKGSTPRPSGNTGFSAVSRSRRRKSPRAQTGLRRECASNPQYG